jgi:hypothetical protein
MDKEQPYWWLESGDVKKETEGTLVAAQYQALSTDHFNKIWKNKFKLSDDYVKITKRLLTI